VYATLLLVVLLSYGLAFIPAFIWKRAEAKNAFWKGLQSAGECYREYNDSKLVYFKEVSLMRNLAESHKND